jgi:colanic acid biosynthesis glycosyl transferase WcaI
MRLTILNQYYAPDLAPTGHFARSLAEHRAELGDRVTVVTSGGGYVTESRSRSATFTTNPEIHRIWTPQFGKETWTGRVMDYAVFFALTAIRMMVLPRQDVVISMTTPPFIAWTGALHKLLHPRAQLVLWNMDCYPEVLERSGVLVSGGILAQLMGWLNRRLFKRIDHLVCLDRPMQELLTSKYQPNSGSSWSSIIPSWERANLFSGSDLDSSEKADLKGLDSGFIVLYLGNAGYGHRFDTMLEAADRLKNEDIAFVFIGGGRAWSGLENARDEQGLGNLHLNHYVPKQMTPAIMAKADCALITLRDSFLGVISPSKHHANLAMGLPLLYVGPQGGNVDQTIRDFECGASFRHGDVDGMTEFILRTRDDERYARELRQRARAAFNQQFSDSVALMAFDGVIDRLMVKARSGSQP